MSSSRKIRGGCMAALMSVLFLTCRLAKADSYVYIGNPGPSKDYASVNVNGSFIGLGQTFLSPGGTLTDLQFTADGISNQGSTLSLVIAPYENGAVGSPLSSGVYDVYAGLNDFYGLSVPTTAGAEYIAFLTIAGDAFNPVAFLDIETTPDSYAGGGGVFVNSTFVSPQQYSVLALPNRQDLVFAASFDLPTSVTPEPSSLLLIGTGVLGVAGLLRPRRAPLL